MLKSKKIVLGVTGSIAAYKAVEILRELKRLRAEVYVIMTKSATSFVTPLTFQTLSQKRVATDLFSPSPELVIPHLDLSQEASLILIAPATANIIGKIASGLADDLLSTTVMAASAPVLVAPAMNAKMYENPIVKSNIEKLRGYGYKIIPPEYGKLASLAEGKGRLASTSKIIKEVIRTLKVKEDLKGTTVLVTASCTQEPIDPLRFISNYSTGKMGYCLASSARDRGAKVLLISGPTYLSPPEGVKVISVKTAQEMKEAVLSHFKDSDLVIKAAAVADYRPRQVRKAKVKKSTPFFSLELERTPDILEELGKQKKDKILIGFAAETEDLVKNAKIKMKEKNLDLIVANDLTLKGSGMGSDTNIAKLIFKDGKTISLPRMKKEELAEKILDQIEKLRAKRRERK